METLRESVAVALNDPEDASLARGILGTDSVEEISARVEAWCVQHLGRQVIGCLHFTQSVGAVFVLQLEDDARVVLKAHALGSRRLGMPATIDGLAAVYRVQAELSRQGLPCAAIVNPPVLWAPGAIAAMEHLQICASDDAHLPAVRRAMAQSLADFIRRAEVFRDLPHLPRTQLPVGLYPPPHNPVFDFEVPGGEWIDERARAARRQMEALGEHWVVAHADYSASNVRVSGEKVTAIFDFDSVGLIDEMRCLAGTALHFTYQSRCMGWTWARRDEAQAFIEDYERARGTQLSDLERRRLSACAIYAAAYTARCEHALDPTDSRAGGMRELLRASPIGFP